jgi:alpha-glutamyl/putrescinyl thymine pyrophosphorylase clade 1
MVSPMTSALIEDTDIAQPTLFDDLDATLRRPTTRPPAVELVGRHIQPSAAFDTYWRFAAERQAIYEARQDGAPGPWTADPILRQHRFTNCYRAADRVSQFLIRRVAYQGSQDPRELTFRTLLFKLFNKVSTWELLEHELGQPSWSTFDVETYNQILGAAFARGQRLYSAAYVVPPPGLGATRKHTNHLRLLRLMMRDRVYERLADSKTMASAFEVLRGYPAIGDFLAYQFLIDINYTVALDFSESEFVVPGPGARDGIRKCFGIAAHGIERDVIAYMAETQDEHFTRLGLTFHGLRGRRLQLIDCQNLFCEVDKYSRVAHPEIRGISGRLRIKQRYQVDPRPLAAWFPPKWNINGDADRSSTADTVNAAIPTIID